MRYKSLTLEAIYTGVERLHQIHHLSSCRPNPPLPSIRASARAGLCRSSETADGCMAVTSQHAHRTAGPTCPVPRTDEVAAERRIADAGPYLASCATRYGVERACTTGGDGVGMSATGIFCGGVIADLHSQNPDIVQAFFGCMEQVALHFISALYRIPPPALDALLRCAAGSLALQERYSLVAACTFLVREHVMLPAVLRLNRMPLERHDNSNVE